jgi:hypothetical protein
MIGLELHTAPSAGNYIFFLIVCELEIAVGRCRAFLMTPCSAASSAFIAHVNFTFSSKRFFFGVCVCVRARV